MTAPRRIRRRRSTRCSPRSRGRPRTRSRCVAPTARPISREPPSAATSQPRSGSRPRSGTRSSASSAIIRSCFSRSRRRWCGSMDTPSKGERDLSDYCCKVCGERLEREDRGRATRFYCPKCGCYRRRRGIFEMTPKEALTLAGALELYSSLWIRTFPDTPPPRRAAVVGSIDPDVLTYLRSKGDLVYVVGEPDTAPA